MGARAQIQSAARLMTGSEAAAYCRLTPGGLHDWVKKGRVPGPIAGTQRWDARALDAALDRLSGLTAPVSRADAASAALADWEAQHGAD